jgi:hypothetical protein
MDGSGGADDNVGAALNAVLEMMQQMQMRPADLFRALDLDHSKKVDKEELGAGLKRLGCDGLSGDAIESLVAEFDLDGDGVVDPLEWKEGLAARYNELHHRQRANQDAKRKAKADEEERKTDEQAGEHRRTPSNPNEGRYAPPSPPKRNIMIQQMEENHAQQALAQAKKTLVDAAAQGDLSKLYITAQSVGSVDDADEEGRHALLEAAGAGVENALRLLVTALGADVNLKNEKRQTAMHFAAAGGHSSTIRTLCELGADPDTTSSDEETPLMMAAFGGHREAVVQLAHLGVNLDKQTPKDGHDGWSSVHWAAAMGQNHVVDALAQAGASIDIPDTSGDRPVHLAVRANESSTLCMLHRHGGCTMLYTMLYPKLIHHTPYTILQTPYTIHHTSYSIRHTPYTIHHTPYRGVACHGRNRFLQCAGGGHSGRRRV